MSEYEVYKLMDFLLMGVHQEIIMMVNSFEAACTSCKKCKQKEEEFVILQSKGITVIK